MRQFIAAICLFLLFASQAGSQGLFDPGAGTTIEASAITGTVAISTGGTGTTTLSDGGILSKATGGEVTSVTGLANQVLLIGSGGGDPVFGAVALNQAAAVTGTLPNGNTTATSSNTLSAIVARDASGNFTAGTVTAALSGNSSTATDLAANPTDCASNTFATTIAASGDLTCTSVGTAALSGLLTGTGTLDFDLTSNASQDLTVTVTGAALGDPVYIGVPNGSLTADTLFWGWVSATNTVTIRAMRIAGTPNPASGTFRADVVSH